MEPAFIKYIVEELDEILSGGIVSKVHQPDEKTLLIKVFSRGSEERLVISTHHKLGRVHLTSRRFVNPPAPLRFCALLRKRITNSRVRGISRKEGERIVFILLEKKIPGREAPEVFVLRVEITGKSGNVILLDENGVVLDAMRYFPSESSKRAVEPGVRLDELPPVKAGVEEALPRKGPGETWNEAAERLYADVIEEYAMGADTGRMRRAIMDAGKKARRKLENLKGDEVRAKEALGFTRLGELIVQNLGRLKRGMPEAELDDFTTVPPETVRVPMDTALTPRENAERYFKRAKKGKTALGLLKYRIPELEEEIEYIESLAYGLDEAETPEDLMGLEEELVEGGYIKKMRIAAEGEMTVEKRAEHVRRYASSEGFEVLCGKSGAGNDLIVKKHARGEDLWFHAANVPGSHVLIKVAGRGKELTRKTIEEAAALAAWHSKSRGAMKVEVTYTEARNVKKPRGAKPGLVTVKDRKSINVKPREMDGEAEV